MVNLGSRDPAPESASNWRGVDSPYRHEASSASKKAEKKKKAPSETELLGGLEMGGEPVWGLSTKERHLVREAKEKIHAV